MIGRAALALFALAALALAHAPRTTLYTPGTPHNAAKWRISDRKATLAAIAAKEVRDPIVSVGLKVSQQQRSELDRVFWDITDPESDNYQNWLTHAQLERMLAPSRTCVRAVESWLKGVPHKRIGDIVRIEAAPAVIERLFATELRVFEWMPSKTRTLRATTSHTSLPADVHECVAIVTDLVDLPRFKASRRPAKKASEFARDAVAAAAPVRTSKLAGDGHGQPAPTSTSAASPQTIYALYNITDNQIKNSKTTSGIYAQLDGGQGNYSDLVYFDKISGLTPQSPITYWGLPLTNTGTEGSLDIDMLTTVAHGTDLTFFTIEQWWYGFATALLSLGSKAPYVISCSYSWTESDQCNPITLSNCTNWSSTTYVQQSELQWQKLAATGRTVLISSGDLGAPGDANPGCDNFGPSPMNPMYASSSQFVVSVGASSFQGVGPDLGFGNNNNAVKAVAKKTPTQSSGTLTQMCQSVNCTFPPFSMEVPCHLVNSDFTTGCGFSNIIPSPSFQTNAVNGYFKSKAWHVNKKFNRTGRAYPDVSALGQNGVIVQSGEILVSGGTSMSAPLWGGIITLLNDALFEAGGKPLGLVTPLLYKIASETPNAFHKITMGTCRCTESCCSSYGFGADPAGGWSPAGGLGTPNVGILREAVLAFNAAKNTKRLAKPE